MEVEGYSREAFDKALKEEADAYSEMSYADERRIENKPFADVDTKVAYSRIDEAKRKIQDLLAKGQQEAIELNERYQELVQDFDNAAKKLRDFERGQLGMGAGNERKPSGKIVDYIDETGKGFGEN